MRKLAYHYHDPLLDADTQPLHWGESVEKIYEDWYSSSTPINQPRSQLLQLLQDCKSHPPDQLLVRRIEDLGDSIESLGTYLDQLAALGVTVIATEQNMILSPTLVSGGAHETQPQRTDLIRLLRGVQAAHRSQHIRRGHARNRLKALPPPGKAPFGYRRGKDRYALDRAAAAIVKDFVEQFLLFGSLRGAVRHLERKYGKKISTSTGRRWLTHPVYRGDLAYQDGRVLPDTHVAILSRDEAAQVDRLLRRNSRLPPRTASAPRSLAGLVTCGQCDSSFRISRVTVPHQSKEYLYLCPTACPQARSCKAFAYEEVLRQTITTICEQLPQAVAELQLPDMGGMKAGIAGQIQHKQAMLEQLTQLVSTGVLDQTTADLRAYTLRSEIAAIQQRLAQLPPVNLKETAQAVSIPQFWFDLTEAERRFYFREFIRQIQVTRTDRRTWSLKLVFIF